MRDQFVESYAHRLSKRLLRTWLRRAARSGGYDNAAKFGDVEWRVNRGAPSWGVWEEYPFYREDYTVWDEVSDDWLCRPPRLDELDHPPVCVVDIAVQHKGAIIYAIEIKHKHAIEEWKREFLLDHVSAIYEIPSRWILGQIRKPNGIPAEFRLS